MDRIVLIVEDDDALRDLMATVLEDDGYVTVKAENGQRAIELLQQTTIHLVLSDISMPVMDGLALGVYCKSNYPEIPFVLMSGGSRELQNHDDERYLQQGMDMTGACQVLQKPFSLQALIDTVTQFCATVDEQGRFE